MDDMMVSNILIGIEDKHCSIRPKISKYWFKGMRAHKPYGMRIKEKILTDGGLVPLFLMNV